MSHTLHRNTVYKTAYCQSSGAHNIKHMEISNERSTQHWCPSEGSNSEPLDHENDALTTQPYGFFPDCLGKKQQLHSNSSWKNKFMHTCLAPCSEENKKTRRPWPPADITFQPLKQLNLGVKQLYMVKAFLFSKRQWFPCNNFVEIFKFY